MSGSDPMLDANQHVREFAKANRLRIARRDDEEVVLRIGPHKSRSAMLGLDKAAHPLDCHASFGLRPGVWRIFVGPTTSRRLRIVLDRWRRLGVAFTALDFEAWADVPECRLLEVATAHPLTRPHRRRVLSPESRAVATERLAALRRGSHAREAQGNGCPATLHGRRSNGATAEPSASCATEPTSARRNDGVRR